MSNAIETKVNIAAFSMSAFATVFVVGVSAIAASQKVAASSSPATLMAIGLSISAGASLTASLQILTSTSIHAFSLGGENEAISNLYTAISFLIGVVSIFAVEKAFIVVSDKFFAPVSSDIEMMTPKQSIPTLEQQAETHSCISDINVDESTRTSTLQNESKLRQLVYLTCIIVNLSSICRGILLYVALKEEVMLPFEVHLFIILIYVIVVNAPFGIVIGILVRQYTTGVTTVLKLSFFSASGQIIGVFLGYLVAGVTGEYTSGVLRGVNSGCFVCFVVREMLPTARYIDPYDKFVSSTVLGTIITIRFISGVSYYII